MKYGVLVSGERLMQVTVFGTRVRTPEALPLDECARVIAAVSGLIEALAREEGVDPVRFGLGAVVRGSAGFAFALGPGQSRPKAVKAIRALYAVIASHGDGSGHDVRDALNRLESASDLGSVKVAGLGTLAVDLPELRVAKAADASRDLRVTSLEYGKVTGVRVSRPGQIAFSLKPAAGGDRVEIFASDALESTVVARFRRGVWCRLEFARGPDGRRRDLWARAIGPWEQAGLIEAVAAAKAANPGARFDRGALRSVDDEKEEDGARGLSSHRKTRPKRDRS